MRARNVSSTGRTTRAGTPITSEPGGTSIPSRTTAPPPTTLPPASPRPDAYPVEQNAAHADEALVCHDAAVQNGTVPHPDARADQRREAGVDMDDAAVLDVGLGADHDAVHVAAHHAAVPHACFGF